METAANRLSFDSSSSNSGEVVFRSNSPRRGRIWRPRSLVNLVGGGNSRSQHRYLTSSPSTDSLNSISSFGNVEFQPKGAKKGWNTIVVVILVEAKDLPKPLTDKVSHSLYCKIRLGTETHKSKPVTSDQRPVWRQRFELHINNDHLLRVSLWDKGKQKNFMGSCAINLLELDKERTHDIWKELDDGFGSVHLNVTMCTIKHNVDTPTDMPNLETIKERFSIFNIQSDWNVVGQLTVKVKCARGLSGKPNAYCILELDNERVQTPSMKATAEPVWNKTYVFNVYDVTSTLDLRVCDSSIVNALKMEYLGKVSIPLLRVTNGEQKWYALKDKNQRSIAKGNWPRVLLEMYLFYNPIKASIKVFTPKENKYIKKPTKFDVALLHNNVLFIKDIFTVLEIINEKLKEFLEWEDREFSTAVFVAWVLFWLFFQAWMIPLYLLLVFIYFWLNKRQQQEKSFMRGYQNIKNMAESIKVYSITDRIQTIPDVMTTITNSTEYIASIAERLYNLVTFKVPFLSYLMMTLLMILSAVLYFIPMNYIMILVGAFKYGRKFLNPERRLNNDVLDFISRIPDTEIWKDWKELNVPEPIQRNSENSVTRNTFRDD